MMYIVKYIIYIVSERPFGISKSFSNILYKYMYLKIQMNIYNFYHRKIRGMNYYIIYNLC